MFASEILRYVTVPTNRLVCFHYLREVLERNYTPFHQQVLRASQSWFVIYPVKILKRFATVAAGLSPVPSH
jgi:hypothetical protein